MRRFVRLYEEVERTTRTSEKTAALRRYFEEVEPSDAAWALSVLTGKRLTRAVPRGRLRKWACEAAGIEEWLYRACYGAVGDQGETLALLLPSAGVMRERIGRSAEWGVGHAECGEESLTVVMEERVLPLGMLSEAGQRRLMEDTWATYDGLARFVFHKLIGGAFRFGAAKKVVINALAAAAGVEPAVMQHRMSGRFEPTAAAFEALVSGDGADDPARPYPFYLAYQLDDPPERFDEVLGGAGGAGGWQAEWKWDGIRAQVIRRESSANDKAAEATSPRTLVWTRGDELVTPAFPEIEAAAAGLPVGTVLDGEILAWDDQQARPMSFARLQRRLNRKSAELMLFPEVPVVFMAYDVLEHGGEDVRGWETSERRFALEALLNGAGHNAAEAASPQGGDGVIRLSPLIAFEGWDELSAKREESRERGVEGVMLKRKDAVYQAGRKKGAWWKWKVDPYTVDCVMVYAQRGSGRRSSLFTDYTFAVWTGQHAGEGELVPVTKAYSGLTDEEFAKVDRFIQKHTVGKKGSFRQVEPELVFEIAFEGIQESDRHKSGIALRFPRMHRWRTDKQAGEADTLGFLEQLLRASEGR
ncbi:MAG: ATP-dependent DNA ligase [Planctomycetota bacterium]